MKRILSIALVLMMVLSLGVVAFVAAEGEGTLTASSAEAKAGETVVINVEMANNPGIAAITVTYKYDTDVFEATIEKGEASKAFSVTAGKNHIYKQDEGTNVTKNGIFAVITLKIADNAPAGEYPIEVKVRQAKNEDLENVTIKGVNGKVTVKGDDIHTHDFKEVVDAKYLKEAANCGAAAVYFKSCACGEKSTETFTSGDKDAANHVGGTKLVGKKDATEDEEGYTGDTHCNTCDALLQKGQTIDKLTHTHDFKEVVDAKYLKSEATCTSAAVYYKSCACGEKSTETFTSGEKLAHKLVEKVDAKYLKEAANCGAAAVYFKSCELCGEASAETFVSGDKDASKHVGGTELRGVKEATYEEEGYTGDKHCKTCGALLEAGRVVNKLIPSHTHTFKEVVDAKYLKSEATCTSPALYYKSCECGELGETFEVGEKLAHKLAEKADAKYLKSEANCAAAAVYYKSCEVCGEKALETFVLGEKNPANHADIEIRNATEATYEEEGYTGDKYCKACDTLAETGKVIDKLVKPEEKPEEKPEDEKAPQTGDAGIYVLCTVMTLALGVAATFTGKSKKTSLK